MYKLSFLSRTRLFDDDAEKPGVSGEEDEGEEREDIPQGSGDASVQKLIDLRDQEGR